VAGAFAGYLPQTRGQVAVYFKNYPLDPECNINVKQTGHPGACLLALGGLCAQEQGKFWAYHDRVFGQELSSVQPRDVARIAAEAGLDAPAFDACFSAPRTRERLAAEIAEGRRAGVQATPTLYINGRKLPRLNDFTATVDKELQKKGLPPVTPR
jgi:protein-disulfide isomerase